MSLRETILRMDYDALHLHMIPILFLLPLLIYWYAHYQLRQAGLEARALTNYCETTHSNQIRTEDRIRINSMLLQYRFHASMHCLPLTSTEPFDCINRFPLEDWHSPEAPPAIPSIRSME